MSAQTDDAVRQAAKTLVPRRAPADEVALLAALARRMITEASSFDPEHGLARIVAASEQHPEVRLTTAGDWKIGSAPEGDLLAIWGNGEHPSLERILDGVQESFSSAKVSALVSEIKELLA